MGGEVDAGFVEEGVVGLVCGGEEEGVGWGGADEGGEGGVVLEEEDFVLREGGWSMCLSKEWSRRWGRGQT